MIRPFEIRFCHIHVLVLSSVPLGFNGMQDVPELIDAGKLSLPLSVHLHACSLLQAWTPKWVRVQVDMAVVAAINVTAVIAAVKEYRNKV